MAHIEDGWLKLRTKRIEKIILNFCKDRNYHNFVDMKKSCEYIGGELGILNVYNKIRSPSDLYRNQLVKILKFLDDSRKGEEGNMSKKKNNGDEEIKKRKTKTFVMALHARDLVQIVDGYIEDIKAPKTLPKSVSFWVNSKFNQHESFLQRLREYFLYSCPIIIDISRYSANQMRRKYSQAKFYCSDESFKQRKIVNDWKIRIDFLDKLGVKVYPMDQAWLGGFSGWFKDVCNELGIKNYAGKSSATHSFEYGEIEKIEKVIVDLEKRSDCARECVPGSCKDKCSQGQNQRDNIAPNVKESKIINLGDSNYKCVESSSIVDSTLGDNNKMKLKKVKKIIKRYLKAGENTPGYPFIHISKFDLEQLLGYLMS